jgi:hypothetical protein
MYLVVFGNRSELDERIPPAERDAFFEGLVSTAGKLRANYAQSWKARRRHLKTRRQSGPPRCLSRFNDSDDEDEEADGSQKDGGGQKDGSEKDGDAQNEEGDGIELEDAARDKSGGEEKNQSGSDEESEAAKSAAKQQQEGN